MNDTILIQAWLTIPTKEKEYDTFICYTIEKLFEDLRYIGQNPDYKSVTVSKCIMLWEEMALKDYVRMDEKEQKVKK